jgi:hypothetical protein
MDEHRVEAGHNVPYAGWRRFRKRGRQGHTARVDRLSYDAWLGGKLDGQTGVSRERNARRRHLVSACSIFE